MGDVYNWSTVLRTEYNVINDNCGAHRVNSLKVDVIVPLRGTYGEMGGLLIPTAALLRSLQWVSDSRSRVAEPMGRWEMAVSCVRCTVPCVDALWHA